MNQILSPGQNRVMDRDYQCHKNFALWQAEKKYFIFRNKAKTQNTFIESREIPTGRITFFDAIVLLGTPYVNQTRKELRLIGYRIGQAEYWVATDSYDLSAEQFSLVYKPRWEIEKIFGWWKQYLKVYHLIARSEYGFMVQTIAVLITYLLLFIYCYKHYRERVSFKRVRELRIKIKNEARGFDNKKICMTDHLIQIYKIT